MITLQYQNIVKVSVALIATLTLCSCMVTEEVKSTHAGSRMIKAKYHNPDRAAQINVELALEFLNKGDTVRAKKKLLLAKKIAPNDPMVWYGFGYFFENTGDLVQAEQSYQGALQFKGQKGESHNNYGTFLCRHGRVDEALHHFEMAVKDPEYLDLSGALENAGVCSLKLPGRQQQAIAYFKKALEYNTSADVALINLAELYYNNSEFSKAREYLIQLSYMAKPTENALRLRAQVEQALGHTEEQGRALAALQKCFPDAQMHG